MPVGQERETGSAYSPAVSEVMKRFLSLDVDTSIENLSGDIYEGDECDFDGAVGGKSAKCGVRMRKYYKLHDECRTKKQNVPKTAQVRKSWRRICCVLMCSWYFRTFVLSSS